jgi:UPF0271 protein
VRIDLNADVGESIGSTRYGDDEGVMPWISSASIACGFHAGNPDTMRITVQLALSHGVAVGAHPAFQDLEGFGRRDVRLTSGEIENLIAYQVGALAGIAAAAGARLAHVKPHGALYNMAARDAAMAAAIARAVAAVDRSLVLFGLSGSHLMTAGCDAGLRVASEAFPDRAYLADGGLAPRSMPGAVLTAVDEVAARALEMAQGAPVKTIDGGAVRVTADTLCVHSDTPGAGRLARALRETLQAAGIEIRPG